MRTPWLEQDQFGKILRNSSQSAKATCRDRRLENSDLIFSEQMFSTLICLNFLPRSTLDLKEKSGRVILAEFNSFPSHVVNKDTGLEDQSFSKCGHARRH